MPENGRAIRQKIVASVMDRAARHDLDAGAIPPADGAEQESPLLVHDRHPWAVLPDGEAVPFQSAAAANFPEEAGGLHALALVASHLVAAGVGAALAWLWLSPSMGSHPSVPTAPAIRADVAENPAPLPPASLPMLQVPAVSLAPELRPVVDPLATIDQEISHLLYNWMEAWTRRNVEAYLGFYSDDFQPADGSSRARWADGRRNSLQGKTTEIRLHLHDLVIVPNGADDVKAVFLQDYASGSYREAMRPKTIKLKREAAGWRITGEWQETVRPDTP